jgi:glycosyltransferase involved in cell wall biosynthesis
MKPVVSVVIPTVRGGALLREAVASVQGQSLGDWELIVVADGCSDDLDDLARDDPRVRVVRQRRRGVSVARNVGLRLAGCDLVAFLDDDDRMLERRLQTQLEVMADPAVGLCHAAVRTIDAAGAVIGCAAVGDVQYRDLLRRPDAVALVSVMTRRRVIQEAGGFDALLRSCEDLDLILRIAREHRLAFVPQVLVEHRRHGDATHAYTLSSGFETSDILRRHLCWAEAGGAGEDAAAVHDGLAGARRAHARVALARAWEAFRAGVRYALRSVSLDPLGVPRSVMNRLGLSTPSSAVRAAG